jgi:hypothetical protein
MKIKTIILYIFSMPIYNIAKSQVIPQDFIFQDPISYTQDSTISKANREFKDSGNFTILRGRYLSGTINVEITENRETQLNQWRLFYPSGKLKEIGIAINESDICIGEWTYYSDSEKIDSVINYDNKLNIPYLKAIEIAKSLGFKTSFIETDLVKNDNILYWQIRKWNMKNGDGLSETILISTIDGCVVKPAHEEEMHY